MKKFFFFNFTSQPFNRSKKINFLDNIKNIEQLLIYVKEKKYNIFFDNTKTVKLIIITEIIDKNILDFLNNIISNIKIKRENIYITSLKSDEEASIIIKKIEIFNPEKIFLMGNVVIKNILKKTELISKINNQIHYYNNIKTICSYSPSFLLKLPEPLSYIKKDIDLLNQTI